MADVTPQVKHQSSTNPQIKKNPRKFYSHFLFKTLIFTIFLAIIPFFPSESPVFASPQSISTRGWELLYLIFVGIVVSYGLFSRRRNLDDDDDDFDGENNNNSKFENAHSYMSRLLQFPSVFDDEAETPSGSYENINHNSTEKLQTWNSRYFRNESMVVLANKRGSVSVEKSRVSDEKPLLLPVRSLKSRVSDEDDDDDNEISRVFDRANSKPKIAQKGLSNGSASISGEDYETSRVFNESNSSSRVSNRSNSSLSSKCSSNDSGRTIRQESMNSPNSVPSEVGYVNEDYETSRVSNRSNSSLSSKSSSNDSRRRGISKHGSLNSRYSSPTEFEYLDEHNVFSRALSSSKDSKEKSRDFDDERMEKDEIVESKVLSSPIPWETRSRVTIEPSPITFSRLPSMEASRTSKNLEELEETKKKKNIVHNSPRLPPRAPPPPPPPPPLSISRSFKPKCINRENTTKSQNVEIEETNRDFLEGLIVETDDDDSESEDNERNYEEEPKDTKKIEKIKEEEEEKELSYEGPDVDKKADEFIAKFREQIRLQRIDSIKRSTKGLKRRTMS